MKTDHALRFHWLLAITYKLKWTPLSRPVVPKHRSVSLGWWAVALGMDKRIAITRLPMTRAENRLEARQENSGFISMTSVPRLSGAKEWVHAST